MVGMWINILVHANTFFSSIIWYAWFLNITNYETISLESNNFAMAGLEPAILDFGRPMPYPFGHMAFMDTGELGFDLISKTMVKLMFKSKDLTEHWNV